jgi:MFS family permease
VKLICAPIFGYLADIYGRKIVNLYGVITIAVIMGIMPYAA